MNRKSIFVALVLLCLTALAACSGAPAAATGVPVTGNDNSQATQVGNSAATQPAGAASTQSANAGQSGNTTTGATTRLNLNTATEQELMAAVPGLGERMLDEFLEYRPYVSIQQFRQEIGKYVDESQLAEFEKYVYVPISINDSDVATLQQITGLTADEAQQLIAGRPYASVDDFLAKLSQYVSTDELNTARTLLLENK
jgi:DNA uptake protein ComE-like DNA-binding protein